jgi:hypothetical protein
MTQWAINYCVNWGSRQLQYPRYFLCDQEPTQEQAIEVLNRHGIRAELSWFEPRNSGLLKIERLPINVVDA